MELKEPTAATHTLEDGRQLHTRVYIPGKVATVEGVFSKEECSALIAAGKKNGFNTNDDENALDQRMRYEWYDEKLAQRLFVAIRHVLKDQLSQGRVPTRVRDKLRLYRYDVGDSFRPHVDGGYTYRTGPLLGESAVYTFVLFLNDASSGLEGGATRFCDVQSKGWPADAPKAITPETGKVLVFQQKHMAHEGGEVRKGTKYIIQGMVMYSRPVGTTAIPAANIFEQVVCKDDQDQSELSTELNDKVQWRPSCPGMEEVNAHERLVRMAKAGLPEAAIVETLKRHGVPQTQIDVYLPKILSEAKERISKDEATSEEEEEDRTSTGGGDMVPHKKGSLKDTVYYSMLKAGHAPPVVRQRMIILGKIEPASADRLVQLLVAAVKEEGENANYDY